MRKLIIKARRKAFGLFSAHRYSTKHSEGLNFEELREYQVGDNVRRIDYKITAKTQKPFVKVFSEEKELNIVIAGFFDYKTYFGSKMLKSEKMLEIISALSFGAIKSGDKVTLELFGKKDFLFKPTKDFGAIFSALFKFDLDCIETKIDYEQKLLSLMKHKKNSVLILVSDFFFYSKTLKKLGSKFDTYAVIVRDRVEEDPTVLNGMDIINPLTKQVCEADFTEKYKTKLLIEDTKKFDIFKHSNIRYMKLYTDEDILKLRRIFG